MDAYTPSTLSVVVAVGLIAALLLAVGFLLSLVGKAVFARPLAWAMLVLGLLSTAVAVAADPPGVRMLAFVVVGLAGLKAIVSVDSVRAGSPRLGLRPWLCFALGWIGMRPDDFAHLGDGPRAGADALLRSGLISLVLGAACILLARLSEAHTVIATILFLVGFSFVVHFGLFDLAVSGWRALGADCRKPFRAPILAESLGEFWSQRWNLPFSEMVSLSVALPLRATVGRGGGVFAAFLVSGLLHELAISVPVDAGYGGPILYFALHGAAVLAERHLERRKRGVSGWRGRLWTILWLIVPLPLLFHPPFLRGIVWPLLRE